jgi:hypothetical protein
MVVPSPMTVVVGVMTKGGGLMLGDGLITEGTPPSTVVVTTTSE